MVNVHLEDFHSNENVKPLEQVASIANPISSHRECGLQSGSQSVLQAITSLLHPLPVSKQASELQSTRSHESTATHQALNWQAASEWFVPISLKSSGTDLQFQLLLSMFPFDFSSDASLFGNRV